MRGKMIWFNQKKDLGFILTDQGERLSVLGPAFAGGARPEGRCAQMEVEFQIDATGAVPQAENVALVDLDSTSPRRARLRSRSVRSTH
jgi:hypothetical protein